MTKRILLIGGRFDVCDRARVLGAEIFLVQKPELSDEKANQLARRVLLTDYEVDETLESLLVAAHNVEAFDAVVSLTEPGLKIGAKLAQRLNIPGMEAPDIVELSFDKYAMRTSARLPISVRVAAAIGTGIDDIRRFADEAGLPIILKPRAGAGSRGVRLVECLDEAGLKDLPSDFLMEEYLDGPEYSVEAFSFNGQHVVLSVTGKSIAGVGSPNPFVESGHIIPASISDEDDRNLASVVVEFLNGFGVMNGPTHTELKVTSRGIKIIETHTRYGGDYIAELVNLATGVDLISLSVGWPLGLVEPLGSRPRYERVAAVRFLFPEVGKIRSMAGLETARAQPGVHLIRIAAKVGDQVKPAMDSNDRCGFVVLVGATAAEVAQVDTMTSDRIKLIVD